MPDIITLGEILIDFISLDENVSLVDSSGFRKSPGGAPANVAAGIAKLGVTAGFIGKVGKDPFGIYMEKVLKGLNVDTQFLMLDGTYRTTLSFVALKPDGLRDCMFYRNPGADMMLSESEIDEDYIASAKIFHFGSISLSGEHCKRATTKAIEYARKHGLMISYDPNLRPDIWQSEAAAYRETNYGLTLADVVKISDEEYPFITGCGTCERCAEYILEKGAKLAVVTLGEKGCFYSDGYASGYIPGYRVDTVETTGAGDAFVASLLVSFLERRGSADMFAADSHLLQSLKRANAAGALATCKYGAIPSLPARDEIDRLIGGTERTATE